MGKIKVLTIFGTRPEAIKMAPLVKELEMEPRIDNYVCVTAQHREMLDQVLEIFNIKPEFDLDIMQRKQTITDITSMALKGLNNIMDDIKPDIVLVHGDTSTTFAGALAAFYNKISVGHVEAGLRTYNKYSPYPEEMNRILTGNIADVHFAPTRKNKESLIKENITKGIYVTGNTVIDAMKYTVSSNYEFSNVTLKGIDFSEGKYILLTAHRRENLGGPLKNICKAVKRVVEDNEDVRIIYPVHLNPTVKNTVYSILGDIDRVNLIAPIDVRDMHNLMDRCYMIMTDSGGIQEEAPSLGKPVLVLRTETERPEAVESGTVRLVGVVEDDIYNSVNELLSNKKTYDDMAKSINPYGDGNSSKRGVQAILHYFGMADKPEDFNHYEEL